MGIDPKVLRSTGALIFGLWLTSLISPLTETSISPNAVGVFAVRKTYGFEYLICGWLGVLLVSSFAWIANLTLALCMISLMKCRSPYLWLATLSLGLALTALLPIRSLMSLDLDGSLTGYGTVRGPAVFLWLTSFCVLWITTVCDKFLKNKVPR